ncbi:MAK10-like protein [Tanacetum coccineum]
MGDANPIRTLGDNSRPRHEGYKNTIELPEGNNMVPLRSDTIRRTIDQSADGKLCERNAEESWALLEDLVLYDNESWNVPRDFSKPVKAISLPQDVLSTSDHRLIELENQLEAHLAPKQPIQVNKITSSCEICSSPHDTQYCMENPKQAFVEYASSRIDEARGLVSNFMASQDARLSKFEADFKHQQSEMTNKIDTVLKAITDRMVGALSSDTVKNPKLNVNSTSPVLSTRSYPIPQPVIEIRTQRPKEPEQTLEDEFKDLHLNLSVLEVLAHGLMLGNSKPFDTLADLGDCVNIIPLYLFKKLNIGLLEETNHVFGLADGTKSYPIGIVKDVEVHIGRLKLLTDFYVTDMKKDPKPHLLVGRGFLATANAVIDCRKAKIVVGEGITSSDGVGARTPYYARKDFLDCHLPGEWEIARDAKTNPFKDVLVFRRMVEFLGAIPINLKRNMWESEDLIKSTINWDKPPKNGDGAWHAKIRLIDPDEEEFTKTPQSVPTSRKLSEREDPREIIDLDHFYDT